MKMRSLIILIGLVLFSCEKQDNFNVTFTTGDAVLSGLTATISTSINADIELEGQGIIYDQTDYLTINTYSYNYTYNESGKILDTEKWANREYVLTNLEPNTTYYYRLYAINNGLVKYGEIKSFSTW